MDSLQELEESMRKDLERGLKPMVGGYITQSMEDQVRDIVEATLESYYPTREPEWINVKDLLIEFKYYMPPVIPKYSV